MALKRGYQILLDEANALVDTVSVDEVADLLDDDGTVIVDIRDIRELERNGQIPGAMLAPRGMLEFWVDPDCKYHKDIFASGKTFIFYCGSGWRSALSAKTLMDMGLPNVKHLDGGFSAWCEAGQPIAERKNKPLT